MHTSQDTGEASDSLDLACMSTRIYTLSITSFQDEIDMERNNSLNLPQGQARQKKQQ